MAAGGARGILGHRRKAPIIKDLPIGQNGRLRRPELAGINTECQGLVKPKRGMAR
jgi:hypothetical protein